MDLQSKLYNFSPSIPEHYLHPTNRNIYQENTNSFQQDVILQLLVYVYCFFKVMDLQSILYYFSARRMEHYLHLAIRDIYQETRIPSSRTWESLRNSTASFEIVFSKLWTYSLNFTTLS